jgi:hypothetical protein
MPVADARDDRCRIVFDPFFPRSPWRLPGQRAQPAPDR